MKNPWCCLKTKSTSFNVLCVNACFEDIKMFTNFYMLLAFFAILELEKITFLGYLLMLLNTYPLKTDMSFIILCPIFFNGIWILSVHYF